MNSKPPHLSTIVGDHKRQRETRMAEDARSALHSATRLLDNYLRAPETNAPNLYSASQQATQAAGIMRELAGHIQGRKL